MPNKARRLARLIRQIEQRVTDIEQGRPPDAPEQRIENVPEEQVGVSDSVTITKQTDVSATYNSGDDYNETEYK